MAARVPSAPEVVSVDAFGGGLNLRADPKDIAPDEWSNCDGWRPLAGAAEVADGWTQIHTGSYLPAVNIIVGMVPDLVFKSAVLIVVANSVTQIVRLFRMDPTGFTTEIGHTGVIAVGSNGSTIPTTGFLKGQQLIACGIITGGVATTSVLAYDGTQFVGVPQVGMAQFITAAAGHAVTAFTNATPVGMHQVRVSDAGDFNVWTATPGNSADEFETVGHGEIIGLVPWGSGFILFTRERLYLASATGGEPPFTVEMLEERGNYVGIAQQIVPTPIGVIHDGVDDLYRIGSAEPLTKKSGQFFYETALTGRGPLLFYASRQEVRKLLTTQIAAVGLDGIWWKQVLPSSRQHHAISEPTFGLDAPRLFLLDFTTGNMLVDSGLPQSGATVDSKDFMSARPSEQDHVLSIKVQWEALTNVTTDRLEVWVATRNHFNAALGTTGLETSPTFVQVGTLAAGQSELDVRVPAGKITRWRFRQSSGRLRVRGFSFRRQRGPARRT